MPPATTRLGVGILTVWLLTTADLSTAQRGKEPAPRFYAKTTAGETFTNESVKGKVVLFEFWTTWCPYCAEEASMVDQLGKELSGQGLILLAVNVGESKKTVKKYLDAHPRNCRIVLMEDTNLAAMYAATRYPIYVIINRDGNVAAEQRGAGGRRLLERNLARAGISAPEQDNSILTPTEP